MLKSIYSYACIGLAVLVSLATSFPTGPKTLLTGSYRVQSDCPDSLSEGTLEILIPNDSFESNSRTLNEGTQFGFPSDTLNLPFDSRIEDGGAIVSEADGRHCKATVWNSASSTGLFSCYEQGNLLCTIFLERIEK